MKTNMPRPDSPLRIGTRGSPLALAQAYETRDRLMVAHGLSQDCFTIAVIKTSGDLIQDRPLSEVGGKGLFTKEIEEALLADEIDIAVHSMKDMPVDQPNGLMLDCYLPREDVRDAFLSPNYADLAALPKGAKIGTSSLRRRAQILYRRPDLQVVEFRGNVQTRLRKLEEGIAACTFLAMAGLNRLGVANLARAPVDINEMLPAVAQGAIGIELRADNVGTRLLLGAIHHAPTGQRLAAERAFLRALDGSCQMPIAGLAELDGDQLHLRGEILRPDGSECLTMEHRGHVADAAAMGIALGEALLAKAGPNFFNTSLNNPPEIP